MALSWVLNLSRPIKRLVFLLADTLLVVASLYLAFALRYGTLDALPRAGESWVLLPIMAVVGALVINALRLPRIKLIAFENRALVQVGLAGAVMALLVMAASYLLRLPAPRSVPMIFGTLFFMGSVSMRVLLLLAIQAVNGRMPGRVRVAIYGAGAAGIQLASALRQSSEAQPILFVDDNSNLQGLMVAGLKVHSPTDLRDLVTRHHLGRILLAIPSVAPARRNEILKALSGLDIEVQMLPSYIDMMSGTGLTGALRAVTPDELLGRDKVDLDVPEIARTYAGRSIMVTGAGGSIGSELCRQLLDCAPARLVLFEQAEYQLYAIDQELRPLAQAAGVELVARLGSVTSMDRVAGVIAEEGVEIILHAAAYKHVPLVEDNELEGVKNNVFGTQTVAEAALVAGVERCILVSTDKAVRPTNVMGASKRMAEQVMQDIQTRSPETLYSMVRFGNVLGSSGSVLPLFQKQIAMGGPITVTHPDVTRFFMTIPEAARLVLLAGAFAKGADVFVLDMGEPQKIIDIARQMITLSGRREKDPISGEGDIEIRITGLRPGEKLYEELLIADDSLRPTPHPKIMRAEEAGPGATEVAAMLDEIQTAITQADRSRLRRVIHTRVEGYHTPAEGGEEGAQQGLTPASTDSDAPQRDRPGGALPQPGA